MKQSDAMVPPGSPDSDMMEGGAPMKPKRSCRTLMVDWAEHTGMHGLPNITRNHNPVKKLLWTLLLMAGLGIMIWQIAGIVEKYYSYPISVQRSVEIKMPRPFPAVTVCNMNAARANKVTESFTSGTTSTSNSTATATTTVAPTASTTPSGATTIAAGNASASTSPLPSPSPSPPPGRKKRAAPGPPPPPSASKFSWMTGSIYSSNATRNLSALGPDTIPDSLGITYTFLDYYNSLTATWKSDVGYQIQDFLIDCSVGTQYCNERNFSRFLHPLYGNCYTFNAARTDQSRVTVLQSGPLHGLKMTLYIEQTEYVGAVANSAGVTTVIHEPNKQPFPEDSGISISPGQETHIGLTEVCTKRLASPYADDCQKDYATANMNNNIYSVASNYSLPSVNYSQTACMKTCIQRKVEMRCNCSSPNLPISNPLVDPLYDSSYNFCMYEYNSTTGSISTNAKCMQSAEKDAFTECRQNCKQDCDEYVYMPSLSHSVWPSDAYENDSQRQIMSYNQNIKNTVDRLGPDERRSFMSKNFVKILVYFDDPLIQMVVSTEGYLILDVLSDMGGQVGLWLGLSVLTLFEIVEMFLDLGLLICKKTRRPRQPADAWKWTTANAMMRAGGKVDAMQQQQASEIVKQPPQSPQLPPLSSQPPNWYEATGVSNQTELRERGRSVKTVVKTVVK